DDMQNLLNGTDIATLFLDRELRIKRFSEQARRVVRLIATDVGRPIGDLVPQVRYDTLTEDAQRVLDTLLPHEAEIQTLDGRWLLVRMLPYRTAINLTDGVVLTFVDIDRLKRAESLAASSRFAESIVQTVREPLVVLDAELRILSTNRAFCQLVGEEREPLVDQFIFDIGAGALALPQLREVLYAVVFDGRSVEDIEFRFDSKRLGARTVQLNARRLEAPATSTARLLVGLAVLTKS
ncbi:MAG: Chemotaxis protein methyltransferase, partial [Pseudomonadota bacterium]